MLYTFHYNDGSYLSHEMEDDQYNSICKDIEFGNRTSHLSFVGFFVLKDIRAIIPNDLPEEAPEGQEPDLSPEEREYMQMLEAAQEAAEDEVDYTGGASF